MPEILAAVPPLSMPLENSSEMENTSTASEVTQRSSRDNSNTNRHSDTVKKKTIAELQSKKKMRKSVGKRHQKKKTPLRPLTSQQKLPNALQLKSHIPRAIDTYTVIVKQLAYYKRLTIISVGRHCQDTERCKI
ncbi:hypothetical protein DOY81_000001 [Sarcophaga bullata]|nr:hypothetical protein DOY81_000001 [Sarcophaga bullata]